MKNNCGDAGQFPAFRKLDCAREIGKTAWDFYNLYAGACLKGDDGIPPTQPPSPAVVPVVPTGGKTTPTQVNPLPTSIPYIPPSDNVKPSDADNTDDQPKPYIANDDDSTAKEYPSSGKSKKDRKSGSSHFWRNILIMGLIGCGGYFYYKRNNDSFSFVRYRNAPRNFGQESEMMMGGSTSLADSGNFEPPSLPPPPSAMGMPQQHMGGYP